MSPDYKAKLSTGACTDEPSYLWFYEALKTLIFNLLCLL